MIIRQFSDIKDIFNQLPDISEVALWFEQMDEEVMPCTHIFNRLGSQGKVESYATKVKESETMEYHKKYIDVYLMLYGTEKVLVGNKKINYKESSYKENDDVGFIKCDNYSQTSLKQGDVMIIFPGELHDACNAVGKSKQVKKAVAKIPADIFDDEIMQKILRGDK